MINILLSVALASAINLPSPYSEAVSAESVPAVETVIVEPEPDEPPVRCIHWYVLPASQPELEKKGACAKVLGTATAIGEFVYDFAKARADAHPKLVMFGKLLGKGGLFALQVAGNAGNAFRWGN